MASAAKKPIQVVPLAQDPRVEQSRKMVLAIDLDSEQFQALSTCAAATFNVHRAALADPPAIVEEALRGSAVVFARWDGRRGRTKILFEKIKMIQGADLHRPPTYLLVSLPEKPNDITPAELKALGVMSVIEWPRKSFLLPQHLFDVQPDEAALDEIAAEAQGDWRKLLLPVSSGLNSDSAAAFILRQRALLNDSNTRPLIGPGQFVVYHPDPGLGAEVAAVLESSAGYLAKTSGKAPMVRRAVLVTGLDAALLYLRRGAGGLIIWSDGVDPIALSLLEHVAEARRTERVPVMVVVPGPSAAQTAKRAYANLFYDLMAEFNRKEGFGQCLIELENAYGRKDSSRALLELLREPANKGEDSANSSAESLRSIGEQLGAKPGKSYWALADFIPHLLRANQTASAEKVFSVLTSEAAKYTGVSFDLIIVRHVIDARLKDRDEVAAGLVNAVFAFPALTRDRLYRVGLMLERWKTWTALGMLLDRWYERADLAGDHQLLWLAARYHVAVGKPVHAGCFVAQAVMQEPFRAEYLETLASLLAARRSYERSAAIIKIIEAIAADPVSKKILLLKLKAAEWLVAGKRLTDARGVLQELLAADREHKGAQQLLQKIAPK